MVPQYSLHYFDIRGVAESIRLLFAYVQQPFEDVRYQFSEWGEWKSKFFYGTLPLLVIDDGGKKELAQSAAILRFLGEKYGLSGKDEWERAKLNELIDFHKDTHNTLGKYLYKKNRIGQGDLTELRNEFLTNVAQIFPIYTKLLKRSGSGFYLPSGLSIVDFIISEYMYTFNKLEPELMAKYPELKAHIDKVYALPQLQEHIAKRKETLF